MTPRHDALSGFAVGKKYLANIMTDLTFTCPIGQRRLGRGFRISGTSYALQ
jgi:hypothetical protein